MEKENYIDHHWSKKSPMPKKSALFLKEIFENWKKYLWYLGWILILTFSVWHLLTIITSSVDIPYADEWELLSPIGIVQGWSKGFLLGFTNEHRMFSSKFLALLNYHFFGLNFKYQIIFNIFLYICLVFCVWKLVGKQVVSHSFAIVISFLPFLSNINAVVHTMPYNLNIHVTLICFLIGNYLLFLKKNGWWFGWVLLLFSMFNFSGAIGGTFAVCLVYIIYQFFNKSKNYIFHSLFSILIFILATIMWINPTHLLSEMRIEGYVTWPWNPRFFRFLGELIALGFGFNKINKISEIVCSGLVAFPILIAIWHILKKHPISKKTFFFLSMILGILSMLMLIAFGRSIFGIQQAKGGASYFEFAMFLPVLSLSLLFILTGKGLRKIYGIICSSILIIGLYDNFDLAPYKEISEKKLEGKKCVQNLLIEANPSLETTCPTITPNGQGLLPDTSIMPRLELAKKLKVNFTKE